MSSVDVIKKVRRPRKILKQSEQSCRVYIPVELVKDSQYPFKNDLYVASLIRIRDLDGNEKVGVFIEPPDQAKGDHH